MFDTGMYNQGRGIESGLRAGAAIGGAIRGNMDNTAVQNAAARIQAGENQQAVISELMAQSPQAAQQLMNLLSGQQSVDAGVAEVTAIKQRVGDQVMKSAAMPMFLAMQTDDPELRNQFISKTADIFREREPETASMIERLKDVDGRTQFDAIAGTVKAMQQAGVFPDDPSQLQQAVPADVAKFRYWQQMNPNATPEEMREVYNQMTVPFYRSQASAQGAADVKLATEQGMNPIIAAREAGKIGAVEQTATGGAQLTKAQQEVEVGKNAAKEEEIRKAKQLDLSQQTVKLAREIASSPQLGAVTGIMAETKTFNPESRDVILKAQQLVAMMTSENMKLMSGVLTQPDMELLQTLSTGMRVDDKGIKGSTEAVKTQLTNIANKIEKTLAEKAGGAQGAGGSSAQRDEASIMKEYGL